MACRVRGGGILIQTAIWRWVRAEHRAAEQRDGFDRVGCPILSRRTRGLSELGGCNPPDWLLPVLGRFMRDATRTKQFRRARGQMRRRRIASALQLCHAGCRPSASVPADASGVMLYNNAWVVTAAYLFGVPESGGSKP
jgi:hypothetical protein